MFVKVNNIKLYYQSKGRGEPIILLHGNGEDHSIFEVLIGQLAENYCVYAIDSRGHGRSSKVSEIGYTAMMEDIVQFIKELKLQKPMLYGFSDGGIIGLMLAYTYPDMLSKLIVSGANSNPLGIKKKWRLCFRILYFFTRSKLTQMMFLEPNIKKEDLNKIVIPVLVLAGSNDMISSDDTHFIAENIKESSLQILAKETHSSYVIKSPKLYEVMKAFIKY